MDRLVLSEIVGLFLGGVAMFTTIYFASGELLRYVQFVQSGEGWGLVIRLVLNSLPMALSYTVGMGMLLACLLGFGRLSDDSELTAIAAVGVSFPRVIAPVVGFGLLVTAILAIGVHTVIPETMRIRQTLLMETLKKLGKGTGPKEAFFQEKSFGTDKKLIAAALGGVSTDDDGVATLEDVTITMTTKGKLTYVAHAERARWRIDTQDWKLEGLDKLATWNGDDLVQMSGPDLTTKEQVFALKSPEALSVLTGSVMDRTSADLRLRASLEKEANHLKQVREIETEIARRNAWALAPLVFAVIGAPLGVRSKRTGSGMGYALSVLITFVYWILSQLSLSLGSGGSLPPAVAGQLANVLGLGLGMFFISRVVRYNRV